MHDETSEPRTAIDILKESISASHYQVIEDPVHEQICIVGKYTRKTLAILPDARRITAEQINAAILKYGENDAIKTITG